MVTTTLLTAEQLFQLPDDGFHKHELVDGVLITMVPPGLGHGWSASKLAQRIWNLVDQHGSGIVVVETGFVLRRSPDTVRAPDVAFVSTARVPPPDQRAGYFEGAPDIAVEVISPSDPLKEVQQKVQDYLAAGSRLVWVLNPRRRTVTAYRPDGLTQVLHDADTLTGEDVLPSFTVRVGDLFD